MLELLALICEPPTACALASFYEILSFLILAKQLDEVCSEHIVIDAV